MQLYRVEAGIGKGASSKLNLENLQGQRVFLELKKMPHDRIYTGHAFGPFQPAKQKTRYARQAASSRIGFNLEDRTASRPAQIIPRPCVHLDLLADGDERRNRHLRSRVADRRLVLG